MAISAKLFCHYDEKFHSSWKIEMVDFQNKLLSIIIIFCFSGIFILAFVLQLLKARRDLKRNGLSSWARVHNKSKLIGVSLILLFIITGDILMVINILQK
jgi:hypothetical protein